MSGRHAELYSPAIGAAGNVVVYGHYGRPVLAFPAERGRAWDLQDQGMIDAVGGLLEAGRVKLYCVDAFDAESWSHGWLPLEERARQHERYESWIVDQVVPFIHDDLGGPQDIVATGCSMGAFHAANFALRRADLFPLAICLSGNYDLLDGEGERFHQSRLPAVRRPPRLAALARQPRARVRPGHVGGHDRRARQHASGSRGCWARRAFRTSSTCGATTSRTTGRHGARRSRIISPGSADDADESPDGTAARHRGGLADRVRDAGQPPRPDQGRLRHDAPRSPSSGSRSSRSTCATSRATTSSSTGSPTGTTSRASGSRRSR